MDRPTSDKQTAPEDQEQTVRTKVPSSSNKTPPKPSQNQSVLPPLPKTPAPFSALPPPTPPPKSKASNSTLTPNIAEDPEDTLTDLEDARPKKTSTGFESLAIKALRQSSWTPMREKLGPLWGWIARHYFCDISIADERLEQLKKAKAEGTIVYIARSHSLLNYLIFNDLNLRKDLPLARMGYGLAWLPWLPLTGQLRAFAGWIGRIFGQGGKDVVELFRDLVRHDEATLFFLKRPQTWLARIRKGVYKVRNSLLSLFGRPPAPGGRQVDLFEELVGLQRQRERPIFLCPQIMIWSRRPTSSQYTFWDFLFGEPEFPGILRESYLFLRERRKSWVRGGAPLNLKTFIAQRPDLDDKSIADELRELLHHRLDREYRVVTGPIKRPAHELIELILKSPEVEQKVLQIAKNESKNPEIVRQRAHKILSRMAADVSLNVARRVDWLLRRLWRRMYNHIQVDEKGLELVREASIKGPVILIPSHKSHIDYLILSQLCYHYDMGLPHIAAGDNLMMPIIGHIFRRCGAFFIRRSFGDDELYRAIFNTYIRMLIYEGHTVEFFIEGGRSRTGKLRSPKMGLLTTIVDVMFEENPPDIHIVPISICYEKIIEGEAYSKELRGADKKKESFGDVLRARKFIKLNFGSLNISFGKPIPLREAIKEKTIEERGLGSPFDPAKDTKDRKHLTQSIAYRVVYDINQVAFITPTSLVTTILLTHERRGIRRLDLIEKVKWLCNEVISRGGYIGPIEDISKLVDRTTDFLDKLLKHPKGLLEPVYKPRESRWIELGYYRNQLIHLFTLEGMLSCALYAFKQHRTQDKGVLKEVLLEEVRFASQLLKLEFIYKPSASIQENFAETLEKLCERGLFSINENYVKLTRPRDELIVFLRALFGPFIDAYWIASLSLLDLLQNKPIAENDLILNMQMTAETLYHEGHLRYSESVSKDTLKNALALYVDLGVLQWELEAGKGSGKRSTRLAVLQMGFDETPILTSFVQRIGKLSSCEKANQIIERLLKTPEKEPEDVE